jgi:hypothetical protein
MPENDTPIKPPRPGPGESDPPAPVPFVDPAHPLQLGWPWAQMADATLRFDAAKRRERAADNAGDVNARERAILDQFEAQADRQKLRDELSDLVLGGLRIALEDNPAAVQQLLCGAIPLGRIECRIDEVEDAVLALERGEAVPV